MEQESASGRYFGVRQSWHWQEILDELGRQVAEYTPPRLEPGVVPVRATGFDLTRQASLGVAVRDLPEILAAAKAANPSGGTGNRVLLVNTPEVPGPRRSVSRLC